MEFHFGFFIFQLCLHLLVERKEFWFLCNAVLRMVLGRVKPRCERLNTEPDQTSQRLKTKLRVRLCTQQLNWSLILFEHIGKSLVGMEPLPNGFPSEQLVKMSRS